MSIESCHWYDKNGTPHHWVEKKDGSGTRPTTIADARKNGWLPSVSGILRAAAKPNLDRWKMEQAAMAVLTSPRRDGEGLDAFMERVLFLDEEHKQEAAAAADKGSAIHDALASAIKLKPYPNEFVPYVKSVLPVIEQLGRIVWAEKVIVGDGYAGRGDLLIENDKCLIMTDFKTTKNLPKKESWLDHILQTSAYAKGLGNTGDKRIITANIYVSTINPSEVALFTQEDWLDTYHCGFKPLFEFWKFANGYDPKGSLT